ncbi:MAG: helix-turn-helix domain-containing protein [Clostridia bacterium]|nr:helix-turn-helix domain-containing protein [Clostridia bacterium]
MNKDSNLDPKNDLIYNAVHNLLDFEKHRSFPEALRAAAENNAFQVVLISRDFNPVLVVETRYTTSVADAVRRLQKHENTERTSFYSTLDVEGILAYWGTIIIEDEEYFLLIVDNEERYSPLEITKLANIIELAIGMWKYHPERNIKSEFIKALVRGNHNIAYTLKSEMDIDPDDIVSVFFARGINNAEARDCMERFEHSCGGEVLCINEGDESYGIILRGSGQQADGENAETSGKHACLGLYSDLKELEQSDEKSVRIYHYTGVSGIEEASDGFHLIKETRPFVGTVFPYKRVFTKYELVLVSNCINIQVQGGMIKNNYAALLAPFRKEMGENKARQLLDTLETFVLDAGMNSSNTSQFMGIHANTVQYRLRRINEVLGADITGNRVIPGLTIALALDRMEKVVR